MFVVLMFNGCIAAKFSCQTTNDNSYGVAGGHAPEKYQAIADKEGRLYVTYR
jgi:hypothetical protein